MQGCTLWHACCKKYGGWGSRYRIYGREWPRLCSSFKQFLLQLSATVFFGFNLDNSQKNLQDLSKKRWEKVMEKRAGRNHVATCAKEWKKGESVRFKGSKHVKNRGKCECRHWTSNFTVSWWHPRSQQILPNRVGRLDVWNTAFSSLFSGTCFVKGLCCIQGSRIQLPRGKANYTVP